MTIGMRSVKIFEVPETMTVAEGRAFLRMLQKHIDMPRPRLVLDCSRIGKIDNSMIHLFLSCLEEVMKRNGDVRLASLNPTAEASLRKAHVDRLFEIYGSTDAAVQSFRNGVAGYSWAAPYPAEINGDSEYAA